jgi:hypothetical protein
MPVQYGDYTRLVLAAQADTDQAHRQLAMDALAKIAPMAGTIGADGHCPGDAAAAPILARLYPPHTEPADDTTAPIEEPPHAASTDRITPPSLLEPSR